MKTFLKSTIFGVCCTLSVGLLSVEQASALSLVNGGTGTTNGGQARFTTLDDDASAGTGTLSPFLRLQSSGTEQGFNTSATPPLDAKAGSFTRDLRLGEVPIINGFRQFLLDINEPNGNNPSLIDLTDLKIYLSDTGERTTLAGLNPVFALGETVFFKDVNSGSGRADVVVEISNSLFSGSGDQFLYLSSTFGRADGGFEEWSVSDSTAVPTPAAIPGLIGMGLAAMRKKRQSNEATQEA